MKKILLFICCLFCSLGIKAANYEIATALSSPYGIYSTFTVFGDAIIKDLYIGAKSVNNDESYTSGSLNGPVIYTPMQESTVNVWNTLQLGGNINVDRDLEINSQNQLYNQLFITSVSTTTVGGDPWVEGTSVLLNFNCPGGDNACVNISSLSANNFSAGTVYVGPGNNVVGSNLYTRTLKLTGTGYEFTFPTMRTTSLEGNLISPLGVVMSNERNNNSPFHCGAKINRHVYGPWITCPTDSAGCPDYSSLGAEECANSWDTNRSPCDDNSTETTHCIQTRTIGYKVPKEYAGTHTIDRKPIISDRKIFYRKCAYQELPEGGYGCAKPSSMSEEAPYASKLSCGQWVPTSCDQLCQDAYGNLGGCESTEREGVVVDERNRGSASCTPSGWEIGSGLECTDSYTRVIYTVYSCPAGSDYVKRPAVGSEYGYSGIRPMTQYRKVTCVQKDYQTPDTSIGNNCAKRFLTLDYGKE